MLMSGGSLNLRKFRVAIRGGASIADACELSGITEAEATFILADDEIRPPPPEAFILPDNRKEPEMAKAAKATTPISGEVRKPDVDLAIKLYLEDIRPAQGKVGEHAQEMSTAYKRIKKEANIPSWAAKLAFKLKETEESKAEHGIRGLLALLEKFNLMPRNDLVDAAQGKGKVGERPKPVLAAVPKGPADDSDLSGDADEPSAVDKAKANAADDEFFDTKNQAEAAE